MNAFDLMKITREHQQQDYQPFRFCSLLEQTVNFVPNEISPPLNMHEHISFEVAGGTMADTVAQMGWSIQFLFIAKHQTRDPIGPAVKSRQLC